MLSIFNHLNSINFLLVKSSLNLLKRAHPEARHDKGERPDRRGAVLRVDGAARAGGGRRHALPAHLPAAAGQGHAAARVAPPRAPPRQPRARRRLLTLRQPADPAQR